MEREKQFKNRSQNADELKARRVEVQVGLRKEKREEHLAKRRHFTEAPDRASAHDGISDEVIGMVCLIVICDIRLRSTYEQLAMKCLQSTAEMVAAVLSHDENEMLSGVIAVRKSLSRSM
jgi:hypothetical protein